MKGQGRASKEISNLWLGHAEIEHPLFVNNLVVLIHYQVNTIGYRRKKKTAASLFSISHVQLQCTPINISYITKYSYLQIKDRACFIFCVEKMAKFSALFCFIILVISGCACIDSAMGGEIGIYELKKGNLSMKLTNYGARIISLVLPDKNGMLSSSIHFVNSISWDFLFVIIYIASQVQEYEFLCW